MPLATEMPPVAFERRGAGPALVLLHPLGADRSVWDPVLGALTARHDVIACDLPGFGASAPLDEPPTPAALARAVGRLLDALAIEDPHVVGNSLGGWVALELARQGHAARVTAIAPAGLWAAPLAPKNGAGRRAAALLLPLLPRITASERGRRLLLAASVARPERVPPGAAEQLVRSYATAPGMQAANEQMRASRFETLAEIDVPVTLAWPDRDRLVSRPRALPGNVRNVTLHGCGHIPMWDDPAQVARVILGEPAA